MSGYGKLKTLRGYFLKNKPGGYWSFLMIPFATKETTILFILDVL